MCSSPELVKTLRGLLEVVSAEPALAGFCATLAAAAIAAKFCICMALSPETRNTGKRTPHGALAIVLKKIVGLNFCYFFGKKKGRRHMLIVK